MSDVLNEAYGIVQCKECVWYKQCVMPMRFTAEDLKRQMETSASAPGAGGLDPNMQNLISSMATAAQNSLIEGCPVLIDRLRASPKLAQRIKELMQKWSEDDPDIEKKQIN